jgi:hypothetical protein
MPRNVERSVKSPNWRSRLALAAALIAVVVPVVWLISPMPPRPKPSVLSPWSRKKFTRRSERS